MPYIVIHLICAVFTMILLKLKLGEVSVGMALLALIGGPIILGMLSIIMLMDELDNIRLF